jgi:hypothetical protein
MTAHRYCWGARARMLLALLLPALLALGAPAAHAQSYLDANPTLSGGWFANASPQAVGGVYYTTFNTQNVASSTAIWDVNLPQAGQYQVFVTSVPNGNPPRTGNARYQVSTSAGTQLVGGIDQNFAGERLLGTFPMNAGSNQVRLSDLTGEPQLSRSVVANAVRWEFAGGGPVPPPPPPPPSGTPQITGYFDFYGKPIIAAPPGSPVIITGNNLGFTGTVQFAGFNAPIVRWTQTAVRVLTPLTGNYPTRGPVTLTTGGQTATGPEFTIDPNAPQPQPAPPTPVPPFPPIPPVPPVGDDWPVYGHDPRQLGLAGGSQDPRQLQAWSFNLGSRPGSSPVVSDGVIYVGTEFTGVYAIDAATRQQRWNQPLVASVRSAPAVGTGVVVVSGNGLYGLSTADGSILWQRPEIIANSDVSPMLVNGVVYIGARGPGGFGVTMYAVNASNGANVWPAPVPLPAGFDNRATVAVAPELGLLFAGLGPNPQVVRPDAAPSSVVAMRLTDGSPAWNAPAVFIASTPPAGMSVGWVSSSGGSFTPQAAVFVPAGQYVMAFSASTGLTLWVRVMPETVNPVPPVVSTAAQQASTLYVAGASGRVYALDSNTGADVAGGLTQSAGQVAGTLALAGTYLYVPTTNGLVAADAASGTVLWTSPLTAASGVAVANGIPYVGTGDGRLVGYGAPVAPPPPPPPPTQVRDLAITRIDVPASFSRSQRGEVFVILENRGATTESYHIFLRSSPGVSINDYVDTIAPGETKPIGFYWPTNLMGPEGQKSLIAEVVIRGATDTNPANNRFEQPVVVGP